MSPRRPALLMALVALLVVTAGCSLPGGGDGGSTEADALPSAASIQENATAVMDEVSSLRMEMTMTVNTGDREATTESTTVVDTAERRLRATATVQGQETETYVINDTLYLRSGGSWQTAPVDPQQYWNGTDFAQQQFLESSNVSVDGTDTVGGNEVYVLTIVPSDEALRGLFQNGGMGTQVPMENVEFEDVHLTQYVDTDSYHVRGTDVSMNMTVQGQESSVDMTLTLSDFGDSFDITLPEDAPSTGA